MLQWFAECADPDAGLFNFRRLSEALGADPVVPQDAPRRGRGRRAAGGAAGHLPVLLGPAGTGTRRRAPVAGDLTPQDADALAEEMLATAGRQGDPTRRSAHPGGTPTRAAPDRRRRRTRPGSTSLTSGSVCPDSPTRLSRHRCVAVGEESPTARARPNRRPGWRSSRWAATAGSSSPTAATPTSLFVHDPYDGVPSRTSAAGYAQAVANELRRTLALPGGDPPLLVDADLRPEGTSGTAGPDAGVVRRLLRQVVGGLGGAGAVPGRRRGR